MALERAQRRISNAYRRYLEMGIGVGIVLALVIVFIQHTHYLKVRDRDHQQQRQLWDNKTKIKLHFFIKSY